MVYVSKKSKTATLSSGKELKNLIYKLVFAKDSSATKHRVRLFTYEKHNFSFMKDRNKIYVILNGNKLDITNVYHKECLINLLTKEV